MATLTLPHASGRNSNQTAADDVPAAAGCGVPSTALPAAAYTDVLPAVAAGDANAGAESKSSSSANAGVDVDWSTHPHVGDSWSPSSPSPVSTTHKPLVGAGSCIEQLELDLEAISVAHSLADLLLDPQPEPVDAAGAGLSDPQLQLCAPVSLGRRGVCLMFGSCLM